MRAAVAVAVSLGVHAALLLGATLAPERPKVLPAIDVTPVEVFEAPAPVLPAAAPQAPAPAPAPRPAAARRTVNVKVNVTGAAVEDVSVNVDVVVDGAGEAPAVVAEVSAPAAPAPPPAPAARTFDVTALHAQLAESARRCYPAAARRFRLTGDATIDFCLDAGGSLKSTSLARSSGHELLDAAARDCVIAGALPFPADASGGCFSVPIRFR
ncbi:MAG: TonB family protein [Myxococcaceae bacterium]|nr:TonB family protein [Myxococcaceae bacterium]